MAKVDYNTVQFKLVGPYAGKTMLLAKGRYQFVRGFMEVQVRSDQMGSLNGMKRALTYYNAHIVGSSELKEAEAKWAERNGGKNGHTSAVAGKAGERKAGASTSQRSNSDKRDGSGNADSSAGEGDDSSSEDGESGSEGVETIEEALLLLDPKNDKHWTTNGLPQVAAVEDILGRPVTRGEISDADEGFNREAASKKAA